MKSLNLLRLFYQCYKKLIFNICKMISHPIAGILCDFPIQIITIPLVNSLYFSQLP